MKRSMYIISIFCIICLTACKNNNLEIIESTSNGNEDQILYETNETYNNEDIIETQTYMIFNTKSEDELDIEEDYENIINMISYAVEGYVSIMISSEEDDSFLKLIKYEDERLYIKKRAEYQSNIQKLELSPHKCICDVNEISQLNNKNIYIDINATYGKQGIGNFKFILEVEDQSIEIRDWYYDSMDSLDFIYRGEYNIDEALKFWENLDNYIDMLNID